MSEQSTRHVLRARAEQFVRAPIEHVYAAYIDPTLMPRWMGIQAITHVSGPLDRPGTTFVEVVFGPYRFSGEVFAAERPTLHAMGGAGLFRIAYRWTTRFAEKDGGTEVTIDAEVSFPTGLIGWLVRRSREAQHLDEDTGRRLALFASLVEAGGPWASTQGTHQETGS